MDDLYPSVLLSAHRSVLLVVHPLQHEPWSVWGTMWALGLSRCLRRPSCSEGSTAWCGRWTRGSYRMSRARGDKVGHPGHLTLHRGVEEASQGTLQQDLEPRTCRAQSQVPGSACQGQSVVWLEGGASVEAEEAGIHTACCVGGVVGMAASGYLGAGQMEANELWGPPALGGLDGGGRAGSGPWSRPPG